MANTPEFGVGKRVQATSGSKEGLKGTIISRVSDIRWLVDFEDHSAPRKYKQENLRRINEFGQPIRTRVAASKARKAPKKTKITSMNQKLSTIPTAITNRFSASKRSAQNGHCIHLVVVGQTLTLDKEVPGTGNWQAALDQSRALANAKRPSFLVLKRSRTAAILVSFLPTCSTGKAKMLQAANLTPLMTALEGVYTRVTKFQANSLAEISSKHFEAYASIQKPLSKTEIALAARAKEDADTRQWLASRDQESRKHNSNIAVMAAAALRKKKKKETK